MGIGFEFDDMLFGWDWELDSVWGFCCWGLDVGWDAGGGSGGCAGAVDGLVGWDEFEFEVAVELVELDAGCCCCCCCWLELTVVFAAVGLDFKI